MAGPPPFDPNAFTNEGQQRANQQKAALLSIIAEQGQAGAQTYAQGLGQLGQNANANNQQAAANQQGSAIMDSGYYGQEAARRQAVQDIYTQDMRAGEASYQRDMGRASETNRQYMDELSASLPLVSAAVQREHQALSAKAEEARAQRAHEAQMRAMEMEAAKMSLQRSKDGDPLIDLKRESMTLENEAARRALAEGPQRSPEELQGDILQERYRINDEVARLGPRAKHAYDLLIREGKTPDQIRALAVTKNPDGVKVDMRNLNYDYLLDILRRDKANREGAARYDLAF